MNSIANFCKICCRSTVSLCKRNGSLFPVSTQYRRAALLESQRQAPLVSRYLSSGDKVGDGVKDLLTDIQLPEEISTDQSQFLFDEVDESATQALPGLMLRGILIPTEETHEAVVDGQKYKELPIAHVHASYNNTIITITDHTDPNCCAYISSQSPPPLLTYLQPNPIGGRLLSRCSPGVVGYRGAKRKTNVAAHSAALEAGKRATRKGLTHVRVALKGIGKGRLPACKGLEMAGLQIVSLTDVSQVNWGSQMPRKARRT